MLYIIVSVITFEGSEGFHTSHIAELNGSWRGYPANYSTQEACEANLLKIMKSWTSQDLGTFDVRADAVGNLVISRDDRKESGIYSEYHCLSLKP